MSLTEWQTTVVAEMNQSIEDCKDIDDIEDVGMELATSSQTWFRNACWPTLARVRTEMIGDDEPIMLVIDALNWVRADFSTTNDIDQTVDHFMRRIRYLGKKSRARWIVVANDSKDLLRKEVFPQYKESRDERPNEITETTKLLESTCEHMQIPWVKVDGYEADDVAATLSTKVVCRGGKAVLCTSDKDYYQLVNKQVVTWSRDNYVNQEAVREKLGISPYQVVDYLCLTGKDDVPSASGIGPKTAAELLNQHDNFLGVYDHRDLLTEKKRVAIEEFAPNYVKARDCHSLCRTLKIDFDWNKTPCL